MDSIRTKRPSGGWTDQCTDGCQRETGMESTAGTCCRSDRGDGEVADAAADSADILPVSAFLLF